MKRIGFLIVAALLYGRGDFLAALHHLATLALAAARYAVHAQHVLALALVLLLCSALLYGANHG